MPKTNLCEGESSEIANETRCLSNGGNIYFYNFIVWHKTFGNKENNIAIINNIKVCFCHHNSRLDIHKLDRNKMTSTNKKIRVFFQIRFKSELMISLERVISQQILFLAQISAGNIAIINMCLHVFKLNYYCRVSSLGLDSSLQ
jgi:hypothetical protein